MKVGCIGCLIFLTILAVVLGGGALAMYFSGGIFEMPTVRKVEYSAADGYQAQQKLFELLARDSKRPPETVVITEREVNAFLARHLEESDLPLSPLVVKLSPGTVQIQGKTELVNLFQGFPFSFLGDYLPESAVHRQVWVSVSGTIEVERRKSKTETDYGRLQMTEFGLGTQELGPWILRLMLGGRERSLLRWKLPRTVEAITIESGRVVITTGT